MICQNLEDLENWPNDKINNLDIPVPEIGFPPINQSIAH